MFILGVAKFFGNAVCCPQTLVLFPIAEQEQYKYIFKKMKEQEYYL